MPNTKRIMKKKTGRRIAVVIAAIFVVLALGLCFAGNYLVDFAIVRKDQPQDIAPGSIVSGENQKRIAANRELVKAQKETWLASVSMQQEEITSRDGLTLRADTIPASGNSHKWVIAVHGYTGKRTDMQNIASYYGPRGFNVLTPDMRSHGESDGKYIGMGWLDRMDVLKWIDVIIQKDPEAEIILHGVSMGGATVMMTSGEALPEQVKGIVEDCGYTSVWDIFSDELSYLFQLPDFPVLYAANLMANLRAGYDFQDASALEQVKKSTVPILFIHGTEDNFVHADMAPILYDSCPAPKRLLMVEGAGHGEAYLMDPETYFATVFDFIGKECGID